MNEKAYRHHKICFFHHLKINAKMKEKMYEYNISHQHTIGISHNISFNRQVNDLETETLFLLL